MSERVRPVLRPIIPSIKCPNCSRIATKWHCPHRECAWLFCDTCQCTWDPKKTDDYILGAVG